MKNIPPFYVGQRVVAVRANEYNDYKKGDEFVVLDLKRGCCSWLVYVGKSIGKNWQQDHVCCDFCDKDIPAPHGRMYHEAKDFAPITSQFQSITFERVLEEELLSVN